MKIKDVNLILKFQEILNRIERHDGEYYLCKQDLDREVFYPFKDGYKYLTTLPEGNIQTIVKNGENIDFYISENSNETHNVISEIKKINHDLDFPYTQLRGVAVEQAYFRIIVDYAHDDKSMGIINKYYPQVEEWRNGKIFNHNGLLKV